MKVPDGFVCHRMPKETVTFPVHLFVEEFGQFLFDIGTIEVNEDDIMKTKELADGMSGAFPKEADREQQFHEWFRNFMASPLYKAGIDSSITDGSLIRGFKDQNYMFLNLEVKNEKGEGGGDPYMQNIAYYIKNLPARLDNQYPCFVLELCGTMFAISGIVNTETQGICDNFTIDYLIQDLSFARLLELTRKLVALRKGLRNLETKTLIPKTSFPYLTWFTYKNVLTKLEFVRQIKPKLCVATVAGTEVIVKFTEHYGKQVHQFCADKGFGPTLYAMERIKPDHWMVVMQKINGRQLDYHGETQEVKNQLREILELIHGHGYVHGDFRANNIMVEESTGRIVVVDFDWSGQVGECVYPVVLNKEDLTWPAGAAFLQPILPDHDRYWLNRFEPVASTAMET